MSNRISIDSKNIEEYINEVESKNINDIKDIKKLIKKAKKEKTEVSREEFCRSLIVAVEHDSLETLELIFKEHKFFIYEINEAIVRAGYRGCLDIVKFLVSKARSYDNYMVFQRAIGTACENGHLETVKYLAKKVLNIQHDNNILFKTACENGHLEIVKYLVRIETEVLNAKDEALIGATKNGHIEIVKYLVKQGADVTADDNKALKTACENGYLEIVKYLVKQGADVTAEDNYSLRVASMKNQKKIVEFLKAKGAEFEFYTY